MDYPSWKIDTLPRVSVSQGALTTVDVPEAMRHADAEVRKDAAWWHGTYYGIMGMFAGWGAGAGLFSFGTAAAGAAVGAAYGTQRAKGKTLNEDQLQERRNLLEKALISFPKGKPFVNTDWALDLRSAFWSNNNLSGMVWLGDADDRKRILGELKDARRNAITEHKLEGLQEGFKAHLYQWDDFYTRKQKNQILVVAKGKDVQLWCSELLAAQVLEKPDLHPILINKTVKKVLDKAGVSVIDRVNTARAPTWQRDDYVQLPEEEERRVALTWNGETGKLANLFKVTVRVDEEGQFSEVLSVRSNKQEYTAAKDREAQRYVLFKRNEARRKGKGAGDRARSKR